MFNLSDLLSLRIPVLRFKIVSTNPADDSPIISEEISGNSTYSTSVYLEANTTYLFYFEREEFTDYQIELNITKAESYSLIPPGSIEISADENSTNKRYILLDIPEPGKAWILSLSISSGDNWTAELRLDSSVLASTYKQDGEEKIKSTSYLLISNATYNRTIITTSLQGELNTLAYLTAYIDKINNLSQIYMGSRSIGLKNKLVLTLQPTPLTYKTPTVRFKINVSKIEAEPVNNITKNVGEFDIFAKLFKLEKIKLYHIKVTGTAYFGVSSLNHGLFTMSSVYGLTEMFDFIYLYFALSNSSVTLSNCLIGQGYLLVLATNTSLSVNFEVFEPKDVKNDKIVDDMQFGIAIYKFNVKSPVIKVKVENETLGGSLIFIDEEGHFAAGMALFYVILNTGYEEIISLKKTNNIYVIITAEGPVQISFESPNSWEEFKSKVMTNNLVWGLIAGIIIGAVVVVILVRRE